MPALLVVGWGVVSLAAPFFSLSANDIELSRILRGPVFEPVPGISGWLGYDELGRPLVDRIVLGARTSFVVAVGVVALSFVLGTGLGMVSAWIGGAWDHAMVRIIDVFLAFPGILLAIALAGVLGPGLDNVVIALSAMGWVGFARLARAQTLSLKRREHVVAAKALGAGESRILMRHVLPYILAPLVVEASFGVAGVVIAEAGLSFLGLGVQPPAASWGSVLREGSRYMLVAPHLVLMPAFALLIVVLSVNLLGDQLRDWLDVRQRFVDRSRGREASGMAQ